MTDHFPHQIESALYQELENIEAGKVGFGLMGL
jgi:hypothetical protein